MLANCENYDNFLPNKNGKQNVCDLKVYVNLINIIYFVLYSYNIFIGYSTF